MEKCTFCVQRISWRRKVRHDSRIATSAIVTWACQQKPVRRKRSSSAISTTPLARLPELAGNPRGYHVLAGLNTKPAITYLARVVAQETPSHG